HMIHGEHSLIGSYESFYLGNGVIYRMDYISFPKLVISQYIPQNLRGRRYRLYVEQMPDWKNDPLYLMNEWSAYINDAEVSLEDYSRGITPANRTDATMGPLEFSVYCTALGMEIKRRDKEVWKQYKPLLIKQLR